MTCEVISKQDVRKPQYSCLEYCSDFPSGLLELNLVPPNLPKGSCLGGGTVSLLCSNGPISCRGKPRSLETIMPWVTWGLTLKPLPYRCHDSHTALDTQGGLVPTYPFTSIPSQLKNLVAYVVQGRGILFQFSNLPSNVFLINGSSPVFRLLQSWIV